MDKENGDNGGDKNKGGVGSGGQSDPNSLLDAASLFGEFLFVLHCFYG